jgi:isoleucyl-tRNA synthetase
MAIGTTVFGRSSYEEVVCLGHILAEDGRKMSKHLGNILEPMPLMEQHGADALRWFMACSGSPWSSRRVGHGVLTEIVRKVLLTYWNTVAFQVLYARAADWSPSAGQAPEVADRHVLDRWLAGETATLVRDVTAAMDVFDTQRTGQRLATFIDDLSNWYVRRSRRRFWAGDPGALATLHDTLHTLTRLLAPLVPFVTERVWQDLVTTVDADAVPSVHLADWPVADSSADQGAALGVQVALARRLTELGRAARAEAKVRTRQPLARVLVGSAAYARLPEELRADVCEELNVNAMEPLSAAGADLVDHTAKANFRALGRRFGPRTPEVARAVAAADAGVIAADLASAGNTLVEVDGEQVTLSADEVVVAERPRAGWSVVNEQGETVALDLELTDELRSAGLAREAVRLVQEARKSSGFDVTDRIELTWAADGSLAEALATHEALVAEEVLATAVHRRSPTDGSDDGFADVDLGLRVWVRLV